VPGYYVENFGCRATQADGAALERQFEDQGLARAATSAQAAVVVLNTCTVTSSADQDARAAIRRVQRQNPEAKIVVTGCYAQRAPEEVAALPGVSVVVGNSHKHHLAEIVLRGIRTTESALAQPIVAEPSWSESPVTSFFPLQNLTANREPGAESPIFVSDIFAHTELLAAPVFDAAGERTRPNLKVQDGCDNRCSFCVIPYVRGQSRSLELDRVIDEVNGLVESGYREVVISGINLGRWGRDLGGSRLSAFGSRNADVGIGLAENQISVENESRKPNAGSRTPTFEDLIRAILAETSLEKLRISSVEPMDWSDDLISLVAQSPRIAKHAHVPMQSGSDAVLRRMHRKYRPWHYREKITKIRAAMPWAAIGADVMTGFPGETDEEFEATRQMIEDLPFTYLHVFTYSPRPGTPAALMPDQVPVHVARERNRILRELAAGKKLAFMRGFIGKSVEAITLRAQDFEDRSVRTPTSTCTTSTSQFTEALTENYLKLRLDGCHEPNRWLSARVEDVMDGALIGRVRPSSASD
jgi:threonylcarbamoyladenosine tRNA methylthiotransferase MtaB